MIGSIPLMIDWVSRNMGLDVEVRQLAMHVSVRSPGKDGVHCLGRFADGSHAWLHTSMVCEQNSWALVMIISIPGHEHGHIVQAVKMRYEVFHEGVIASTDVGQSFDDGVFGQCLCLGLGEIRSLRPGRFA